MKNKIKGENELARELRAKALAHIKELRSDKRAGVMSAHWLGIKFGQYIACASAARLANHYTIN